MLKIDQFLTADMDEQFKLLKDPEVSREVEKWLGPAAFAELLDHRLDAAHLSAGPKNIVFAPGVMGSTLHSEGLGGTWWLDMLRARDRLNALALTPDGNGDLDDDAAIAPGAVDLSYIPFRRALAASGTFGGSCQFPYDWRKPIAASAAAFRDTVLECHAEYKMPVHLVGHSMGGLVIRTALMLHGGELWPKVGQIVFIATPHYGSPSIAGYLKNHLWGWEEIAVVGAFLRPETFRSLRGVLSLLPAPTGVYPGTRGGGEHPCSNFDFYDADAWKLGLGAPETVHLQTVLDQVRRIFTDLHDWHSTRLLQEYKDRMLMIAGVGYETLFRLEFDKMLWGAWSRTKKMTKRTPGDVDREGDGRVPLASAQLEDVTTRYVKGAHGGLPNMPSVSQDVLAWLQGNPLLLSPTAKDALSGHLAAAVPVSSAPHLDGSKAASPTSDAYDRYREFTPGQVAKLVADLEAGRLPDINLTRIL